MWSLQDHPRSVHQILLFNSHGSVRQQQLSLNMHSVTDHSYLTEGSEWEGHAVVVPVWTGPRWELRFSASSTGSILLWCWRAMCSPTQPGGKDRKKRPWIKNIRKRGETKIRWLQEKSYCQITLQSLWSRFLIAVFESVPNTTKYSHIHLLNFIH